MNKKNILDSYGTNYRYKTTKYTEYELIYGKDKIPYIKGIGKGNSEFINKDDDAIIEDLLSFDKYFQNSSFLNIAKIIENQMKVIKNDLEETKDINLYFLSRGVLLDDVFEHFFYTPYTNSKKEPTTFFIDLIDFFEKNGLPESLTEQGNDNSCNMVNIILKFANLFEFIENLKDIKKNFSKFEIFSAKIGLKEKQYDEDYDPAEMTTQFELVSYFDCPFEFTKYILLVKQIVGNKRIIRCEYCKSLIIAGRSDQRLCDKNCRAKMSRKRKKEQAKSNELR